MMWNEYIFNKNTIQLISHLGLIKNTGSTTYRNSYNMYHSPCKAILTIRVVVKKKGWE